MQAGYWGYTEAEALLVQRDGGETRPKLVFSGDDARVGRWDQEGCVTNLCSAPEFSLAGDAVMVALFALCDMHQQQVKFGYAWVLYTLKCPDGLSVAPLAVSSPARVRGTERYHWAKPVSVLPAATPAAASRATAGARR